MNPDLRVVRMLTSQRPKQAKINKTIHLEPLSNISLKKKDWYITISEQSVKRVRALTTELSMPNRG